jgi:hypothetical protein
MINKNSGDSGKSTVRVGCGTRILRVIHGRVEHPSEGWHPSRDARPGTPHARATFSN